MDVSKGRRKNTILMDDSPDDIAEEFDPSLLTEEQQAMVVEHYLGVHPKYMLVEKNKVKINYGKMKNDNGTRYGEVRWKNLQRILG